MTIKKAKIFIGSSFLRAVTSLYDRIDSLANRHAEPQIAAGRESEAMGLNLWLNVIL